ncbi:ubinuclein-1 isoform X2 [Astyanax mexicanus]|uniref:ubinuclein-1 isoform X2 n=1 Tax=Astyanax mexicanus TaxID=7994 RepID=UPI0020CB1543|nr:ubinuclein-1 isoform X2 [Astyanax mexicanus]
MATPRRIQLTTLSSEVVPPSLPNSHAAPDVPPTQQAADPPPPETTDPVPSARIQLVLFEPDERRCPEFYYPELIKGQITNGSNRKTLEEQIEEKERDEMEALSKKFEEKYGGAPKRRKDRLQDLVDMGFGYDETDSFIDNSEAYDELVPACLTTKHGGFYINSGTLQFRQASEEGEENETDDFEKNVKPKKRKLKEGEEERLNNHKKKRQEDVQPENVKNGTLITMPLGEKKKKKKSGKPLGIDGMLRQFHKEKLNQLQVFNTKGKEVVTPADSVSTTQTEVPEESALADPLLTLIGSASADELLQAVKAADQDFDLDGLLTADQDTGSQGLVENQEDTVLSQPTKPPTLLPDGLPPMLELYIEELTQAIKDMEGENKMELFAPEINNVLLHVAVKSKEVSDKVRSGIFSYLASQLSCKKGTLLKRAKKLHLLHLGDHLRDLLQKLEEAVTRTMPEQIDRFNDNCQAHSEAKAAKLEAEKEQRAVDGSDEEEEEKGGKRVFGPRKRFKWTEEIRELLSEVVKMKMNCYELETAGGPSLEEYLRTFLEDNVKPLWPKGWMQSRARKKSLAAPKSKKIVFISEKSGEIHPTPAMKGLQGAAAPQRKRISLPLSLQQAPQNTVSRPPIDTQVSAYFSPPQPELQQIRGDVGKSSQGRNQVSQPAVDGKPLPGVQTGSTGAALPVDSAQRISSSPGVASALKRVPAGEKKAQKLMLVAPPAAAEGDSAAVQGVARLLTTTSFCKAPVSVAVAAVESSCGDPALPTPSLSLQASSYPNVPQSGGLTSLVPLHALPFPGLTYASKTSGHAQICKDSILTSPGPGTFQYGLTHGIYSALCSSVLYPLSGPVSSSPSSLHALSTRPCPLDGSQIHAEGANAQRKLH